MSVVGKIGLDSIKFLGKAAASIATKGSRGTASAIKAAAKRPAFKIRQTGLFSADRTLFPFAVFSVYPQKAYSSDNAPYHTIVQVQF